LLLSQQHRETYFSEMPASFGSGAQLTPARRVETTPKVGQPPHRGVAREAVTLSVDGVEQVLEVVRQKRRLGGQLDYRSRHVLHPAVIRAAKLRKRLGAAPGLLSPIPRKPRHWSPVYYRRLVDELVATERVLRGMLGDTIRALERRRGRLHGRWPR